VVSASWDNTLKLWDPAAGEDLQTPGGDDAAIEACAVAPNGSYLVSATSHGALRLRDPWTAADLRDLEGHTQSVNACAVAPDGSFVVSASDDETLKVWDPETGECRLDITRGHGGFALYPGGDTISGKVRGCAVAPDGSLIVSASADMTLKLWDPATGASLRTLEGHGDWVDACAVSPDGSLVVSGGWDCTVRLWNAVTGEEVRTLTGHSGRVTACAVAPDGSFIVSAAGVTAKGSWEDDTLVKLWDPATGEELRSLRGHTRPAHACAVAPDGSFVVSAGQDKTLKLWDSSTGEEIGNVPLIGALRSVAVHPWLPLLGCGDESGNVILIDVTGIEYGPIIVTAIERPDGTAVRCPRCSQEHPVRPEWLGEVIRCPTSDCDLRLRINSFVVRPHHLKPLRHARERGARTTKPGRGNKKPTQQELFQSTIRSWAGEAPPKRGWFKRRRK